MEKIILRLLLHPILTVSGIVSNTQVEGESILQVISMAQSTVYPYPLADCKNKPSNLNSFTEYFMNEKGAHDSIFANAFVFC